MKMTPVKVCKSTWADIVKGKAADSAAPAVQEFTFNAAATEFALQEFQFNAAAPEFAAQEIKLNVSAPEFTPPRNPSLNPSATEFNPSEAKRAAEMQSLLLACYSDDDDSSDDEVRYQPPPAPSQKATEMQGLLLACYTDDDDSSDDETQYQPPPAHSQKRKQAVEGGASTPAPIAFRPPPGLSLPPQCAAAPMRKHVKKSVAPPAAAARPPPGLKVLAGAPMNPFANVFDPFAALVHQKAVGIRIASAINVAGYCSDSSDDESPRYMPHSALKMTLLQDSTSAGETSDSETESLSGPCSL